MVSIEIEQGGRAVPQVGVKAIATITAALGATSYANSGFRFTRGVWYQVGNTKLRVTTPGGFEATPDGAGPVKAPCGCGG
jgi:hypothetical protein